MKPDAFRELVVRRRDSCVKFSEDKPRRNRVEALDFYNGKNLALYGDSGDGLSTVVSRDVMEAIEGIMPPLVRPFVAGEEVVSFDPVEANDEETTKQATAYVNHCFRRHNNVLAVAQTALKDGLLFKLGIAKVVMEEVENGAVEEYTGLTQEEMDAMPRPFAGDVEQADDGTFGGMVPPAKVKKYRVHIIAPDEFLYEERLACLDEATFLGHRKRMTLADLIGMNVDKAKAIGLDSGKPDSGRYGEEDRARFEEETNDGDDWASDDLSRPVWVDECYIHCDYAENGVLVWRKAMVGGGQSTVLSDEAADDHPYSTWTPIPMPHKLTGLSMFDLTRDIQMQKTALIREQLNNLYLVNRPQREVLSGMVNMDDLLVPALNGTVRVKQMNSIRQLTTPFVASETFGMVEYLDSQREARTGVTRYNQGMDSNSLNKMLCIETAVPMADGSFTRLADIEDGDWIVGSDGEPTQVLAAHEIHDPAQAYRIKFSSGDAIDAGGEHLWTVQTQHDKNKGVTRTINTDSLFDLMQCGRVYAPRVQRPMTGFERELPLDPYVLGSWLGDGSCHAPRITTMEPELVGALSEWCEGRGELKADKQQNSGAATSYYVGGLYNPLRAMQMVKRGDAAKDVDIIGKHIPAEYFEASYRQRLELLRGLMDTDGCHHSRSLAVFCQKGGRLLDDTVRLIKSLGGWPKVTKLSSEGRFRHDGEHFQVFFSLFDCPFKLSRKVAGWVAPARNITTQVIKSIERIAIKPMRCLTVAAPDGLFCVGERFTVTHNTATGINIISSNSQQRQELIARQFGEFLKGIFGKMLDLVKTHAEPGEVERLTGRPFVPWPTDYDATVSVGLGTNNKDQMVGHLMNLTAMDEKIIQLQGGLQGPLLTAANVYEKLKDIVQAMGIKNNGYYTDPSDENQQAPPQEQQQEEPPPDPLGEAKVKAQTDIGKAQIDAQTKLQIAHMEHQVVPFPNMVADASQPIEPQYG